MVWKNQDAAFEKQNLLPAVKDGEGVVVIWKFKEASGVGRLTFIDSTLHHMGHLNALKHCPKRKALAVEQYQNSVAYSSTIARFKPHRTFMGLIRMHDTTT